MPMSSIFANTGGGHISKIDQLPRMMRLISKQAGDKVYRFFSVALNLGVMHIEVEATSTDRIANVTIAAQHGSVCVQAYQFVIFPAFDEAVGGGASSVERLLRGEGRVSKDDDALD